MHYMCKTCVKLYTYFTHVDIFPVYEPQEMDQTMCHTHKKYNKTSKCFIHTELAASDAFLDHTSKIGKLFANGIQ